MADHGKANREAIEDLIYDITAFIEIMNEEIDGIKSDASALSNDWDDPQYETFLAFVDEITARLRADISELEGVRANLQKELAFFG